MTSITTVNIPFINFYLNSPPLEILTFEARIRLSLLKHNKHSGKWLEFSQYRFDQLQRVRVSQENAHRYGTSDCSHE